MIEVNKQNFLLVIESTIEFHIKGKTIFFLKFDSTDTSCKFRRRLNIMQQYFNKNDYRKN